MKRPRVRRILKYGFGGLGLLVVLALLTVRCVYGSGELYADVSTAPALAEGEVEVAATMPYPLGNVTRSRDGRIFFNTHPFAQSHRFTETSLFELIDGQPQPFPDVQSQALVQDVFGMTTDPQDRLWLIAPATLDRERTRLLAVDLTTNEITIDHAFDPGIGRFAQDIRVSPDGGTMYMADTGAFRFTAASILVVDLTSFEVREVLGDHPSTQPQQWIIQTPLGEHKVGYGLLTFSVGVDGIGLSPDGDFLYYATMSHDTLHRIGTQYLNDPALDPGALHDHIEIVGTKPLSDGIEVTADGTVLITDIEHGGIAAMTPDGGLRTIAKHSDVIWADGVAVSPEGEVWFTDSAIPAYIDQLLRPPSLARLEAAAPYRLYRFQLPE